MTICTSCSTLVRHIAPALLNEERRIPVFIGWFISKALLYLEYVLLGSITGEQALVASHSTSLPPSLSCKDTRSGLHDECFEKSSSTDLFTAE